MKTYNNLFTQIYSFSNLCNAYEKAKRNKRTRPPVMEFGKELEPNLFKIQQELIYKTYQTGEYHKFYVYDPKTRLIMAAPFRDRVVHHALCNIISPIFESRFISNSYACRIGKGVDAGVDKVTSYLNQSTAEYGKVYCLKCDVFHYFREINHGILSSMMFERIKCRETRWLIQKILNSSYDHCGADGATGIPVGNLPSQLEANIYLTPLDYWIKQEKRERFYIRYMDDFIILSPDKDRLHELWKGISVFLWDELRLQLNHKTAVFPITQGVDFLGYRIWPYKKLLRKQYVKRIKRMMKKFVIDYKEGRRSREEIQQVLASWHGRSIRANVPYLREEIAAKAKAIGITI